VYRHGLDRENYTSVLYFSVIVIISEKVKGKKPSRYRPGVAQRIPGS
jgi:hypothetical protein